jgi:hypothetical protein
MANLKFLGQFCMYNGNRVIFWLFGIYFPRFGVLCEEKSGNPDETLALAEKNFFKLSLQEYIRSHRRK